MARLIFRDSQGREGTVELPTNDIVYVGRGLECAVRTDDGMVSRRHAQFRLENGRFIVEDLGSANGTHLNSVRVQKQALGHSDVIQCGSLVMRFVDEGGVNIVPQQIPQGGTPPAKKGGTMVLDRESAPAMPGGMSPPNFGMPAPAQRSRSISMPTPVICWNPAARRTSRAAVTSLGRMAMSRSTKLRSPTSP